MSEKDQLRTEERRSEERFPASLGLKVEIDGYSDSMQPFFASGSTLNVSRGGLLARVDRPVPLSAKCSVLFETAEADRGLSEISGKVVRSENAATGCFVAIRFDDPLEELPAVVRETED